MATSSRNDLLTVMNTLFSDSSGKPQLQKSEEFVDAIDDYIIKVVTRISGTTTVPPPIPVTVSLSTGVGATTGAGTGAIDKTLATEPAA